MQLYTALIVDVKNSKSYNMKERNKIQQYIKDSMEALNELFNPKLERKVIFSGGDELQGLFSSTASAFLYLRLLSLLIYPVQIRAGIGIGEWTVKVENGSSAEQDGTAYHYARKAIEDVYGMQTQRFRIHAKDTDFFVNSILNASYGLNKQQSYLQSVTMLLLEYMYPFADEDLINQDGYNKLKPLIKDKYNNNLGIWNKKVSGNKGSGQAYVIDDRALDFCEKIWMFGSEDELEEMLLKKGMAANISKVMGTTRQNIDKMIKSGNMVIIRSLDLAAIKYIKKMSILGN